MPSRLRLVAVVAAVSVMGACGQKVGLSGRPVAAPQVAPAPAGAPLASADPGDSGAGFAPESAAVLSPAAPGLPTARPAGTRTGPGVASPAGGAPVTTGPAVPSTAAGTSSAAGGPGSPTPESGGSTPSATPAAGDRSGVTDTEIVIGMHGPLTGAAPVPSDSVERAKDLYWKFLATRGGIFGRNVRVVFRDDQYNPSRALQVCREMVEQEQAFLLVGIGADQVAPCARYASQVGVPYLSAGAGRDALAALPTYFALSMDYPSQAPMVAQVARRAGRTKVGVVVMNTPNYDDTFEALQASAEGAGLRVVRATRISKTATQSETLAEANALRTAGAEAVMLFVAPLIFVNLAHSAQGQAYNPLWLGPGLQAGLNLVAEFGCPSIGAARFLSPFPQLDVIDRFDADYTAAYRRFNGGDEPDDLGILVWGLEKTIGQVFSAAGQDLTRQGFMAALTSGREFSSNVLPPSRFGPGSHFGATQAHLLEADCQNRRYRTRATFVSSL